MAFVLLLPPLPAHDFPPRAGLIHRERKMMMRVMRCAALAAVAGLVFSTAADAQVVRGRVTEGRTGYPLASVNVTVVDDAGTPAGYGQTNAFGEFTIRLSHAGRFLVRAERVGYRPASSGLSDVRAGDEIYRVLILREGDAQLADATRSVGGWRLPPLIRPSSGRASTDTRPAANGTPADAAAPGSAGTPAGRPEPQPQRVAKPRREERPARAPRAPRPASDGGSTRHPAVRL